MLVLLSFLLKLLCVHVYFFWCQSMEGKWCCLSLVLSRYNDTYICVHVGAFRNSYLSDHCAEQHSSWWFFHSHM
jgi:hypothetical protein